MAALRNTLCKVFFRVADFYVAIGMFFVVLYRLMSVI